MWYENSNAASESDINLHHVYTGRERCDATKYNGTTDLYIMFSIIDQWIELIIISDAVYTGCGTAWQIPDSKLLTRSIWHTDTKFKWFAMLFRVQCRYYVTAKTRRVWSKEKWTRKIDDSNVNGLNSFEWVSDTIFVMNVGSQLVHSFNVSLL